MKTLETLYLGSIEFTGALALDNIVKNLKKLYKQELNLLNANFINCIDRNKFNQTQEKNPINNIPKSFIKFTLRGYYVYIEFGNFWAIEGVGLYIEKLKDSNSFLRKKYYSKINVEYNLDNRSVDYTTIIEKIMKIDETYKELEDIEEKSTYRNNLVKF